MMKTDSVYELQENRQFAVSSLAYIIPLAKKQTFRSILGGDVLILKTVTKLYTLLNTNMDNCKECYLFEYSKSIWTHKEIIVFGVGIVERQFIGHAWGWGKPFR